MIEVEKKILDAATTLFVKNGFKATTTRRIAEDAGVNEVTLFRRFKSKTNILDAVVKKAQEDTLRKLDYILQAEKVPQKRDFLVETGRNLLRFTEQNADLIIMLISEGRKRPEVLETLSSIPDAIVKQLTEYFDEQIRERNIYGTNPRVAAFAFASFVMYSGLFARVIGEDFLSESEDTLHDFIDILKEGVLRKETTITSMRSNRAKKVSL